MVMPAFDFFCSARRGRKISFCVARQKHGEMLLLLFTLLLAMLFVVVEMMAAAVVVHACVRVAHSVRTCTHVGGGGVWGGEGSSERGTMPRRDPPALPASRGPERGWPRPAAPAA